MAEETIGLKVKVDTGGADASMGSLKKQLKEAQADVQALSDKFGATSKEAINAAKRAGELKDKIGDAKALVDAFNPDAKFKALTASLSGVAGGFAAVQGGMALLGNESQDVQKALLKVQSAMALSQGLQAVGESIDSFKQLGAVIKNQVSGAFGTLKGAIAATGIGLLVVGVGLLVANFDKVKETLVRLFPDLSKFGDYVMNIVNAITDFVGITSEAERANDRLAASLTKSNEALDRQIKILEAQGGREEEIYRLKRERIQNQIKLLNDANDKEYKGRADLNAELEILDIQETNRLNAVNDKRLEDRAAALAKQTQLEYDAIINEYNLTKVARDKIGRQEIIDLEQLRIFQDEEKARIEQESQDRADSLTQGYWGKRANAQISQWDLEASNDKLNKQILLSSQEQFENAKWNIVMQGLDLLQQLSGQGTAVAKTAALAQIAIDTGRGFANGLTIAQEGSKALGPAAPFAFPIFYATQIAAVLGAVGKAKNILSQVPGGGMGGSSVSAPSISRSAPMAPNLTQAAPTTLSQGTINDIGNQAIKTYVVESDMTSNQQRIAAIQQRARFS
jgi:hypothetical protein